MTAQPLEYWTRENIHNIVGDALNQEPYNKLPFTQLQALFLHYDHGDMENGEVHVYWTCRTLGEIAADPSGCAIQLALTGRAPRHRDYASEQEWRVADYEYWKPMDDVSRLAWNIADQLQ